MKKVKILTIALLIILVTMVAFFGVYVQFQNRMENKVKDYSYTMDIEGARQVRLKVDTSVNEIIKDKDGNVIESATDEEIEQNGYTKEEQAINTQEVLNVENYKLTRKLIQKRLKELNVENYIIKVDEASGEIVVELTEDDKTDFIVSNLNTVGKFEIIDTQTKEILMNNDDIKSSNVLYNTTQAGTNVYLNIEFTKEGAKKLENISSTYVTIAEKTNEETQVEAEEGTETQSEDTTTEEKNEEAQKTITMKIDNQEIMTTGFEEVIKTGTIQLTVGKASTDADTIDEYVQNAQTMATVLDTGKLPITYTLDENKYVSSDMTQESLKTLAIAIAIVVAIALVALIIIYKGKGILGAISYVGLAAVFLLIIRYANVQLSLEGIFGIVLILALNYILTIKMLSSIIKNEEGSKTINKLLGKFFVEIIPVCIITIVFCFIKWIPISSLGMVMFWGLLLIALYNLIITKKLLELSENK